MDTVSAVVAGALFWLPRIAVISLVASALVWVADKSVGWFVPRSGDSAPEFETGNAARNSLLARLLQSEFMRIRSDLVASSAAMTQQLRSWTREFDEINRKKQSGITASRDMATALEQVAGQGTVAQTETRASVVPSEIRASVDVDRVSAVVNNLELLSNAINTTEVPDIKIASVELGPLLRWLFDMIRPPSDNKVVVFDENSAALIEGPIVSSDRIVVEMEPATDAKKRTERQLVEAIAYQILASKLASAKPKIDFGSWTGLRDFVVGTKSMAKLVSQPRPTQDDDWDKQMSEAARLIERAGAAARDWKFIALASFLFERSKNFDNAIRVLDSYAEFARGDKGDEEGRVARRAYLLDRRVEFAVAKALEAGPSDGTVFATASSALARLPSMVAARKLHRLSGVAERGKVKVAILAAKPRWFGLDGPPDTLLVDEFSNSAGLAEVVRALSPCANVVFVPVVHAETGSVSVEDLLEALDAAVSADAPIILLPFGRLIGPAWQSVTESILAAGHLVVAPAGNLGVSQYQTAPKSFLLAESVGLDGKRSSYSARVEGSLGAVGEVPLVDLTEAGPTVAVGQGTSYAAATLAAVAAESVARQPSLKGAALRDALIKAAAKPSDDAGAPVARVVIPR